MPYPQRHYYVYIMTNRPGGVLYVGYTSDISRRALEHRTGVGSVFTKRYNLTRLVFFEEHDHVGSAMSRERSLKEWKRQWKIELIERDNPEWKDLSVNL